MMKKTSNNIENRMRESIRHVLLHEWDPIGVGDEPNAYDEYDSYIEGICNLLVSNVPPDEIEKHLSSIETTKMHIRSSGKDRLQSVVQQLRAVFNC